MADVERRASGWARVGSVVCCRLIITGVVRRGEMGIGGDIVGGMSQVMCRK